MASISTEMICGGCNSSYGSCTLVYPYLYYACGPIVLIHNLLTHKTIESLQKHKGYVNCIVSMNSYLLTGASDKKVIIWQDYQPIKELQMTASVIHLNYGSNYFTIITTDGLLSIFTQDFSMIQSLNFHKNLQETTALAALSEITYLATGGADARIHIYTKSSDSSEFVYKSSLEGHIRNIRSLSFKSLPDSLWLASGGQDSLIRIWKFSKDLDTSEINSQGVYNIGEMHCKLDAVISGHNNLISSVLWINENLLTASHDFSVILWHQDHNDGTWTQKATFGQLGGNKNIFLGAIGVVDQILAYSYSGGFYYWKEDSGNWIPQIAPTGHYNSVTDIMVCDNFAVTCSLDQTCRLWAYIRPNINDNGDYWMECSRPMIHGYDINSITMANNQLISGADEKIIRIFDPSISTAEILQNKGITLLAETRGSSQVLGLTTKTSSDTEINLKNNVVTEDLLNSYTLWPESNKLYGHGYEISVTVVNSSGTILASACKSQTKEHSRVFLWDLTNKQKIQSLEFHSLSVTDISFSHNDQFLLTVSRDRSWCLYYLDNEYKYKISNQVHSRVIYTCCWSPNDNVFATGSRDKKLKIWNVNGDNLSTLAFSYPITAACFITENLLAVGLENGELIIMDIKNKLSISRIMHGDTITKLRFLSGKLYSISSDHTFRIYLVSINE